jgi:hypothetical protein
VILVPEVEVLLPTGSLEWGRAIDEKDSVIDVVILLNSAENVTC